MRQPKHNINTHKKNHKKYDLILKKLIMITCLESI